MPPQAVLQLAKCYHLSRVDASRLAAEYELTRLKVEYSLRMVRNLSIYQALVRYAGLKRFTRQAQDLEQRITRIRSNSAGRLTSLLFANSDYVKNICTHKKASSCFSYDIWNNEGASIHFTNAVLPENPFKGTELEKRKKELKKIALDIQKNHPEVQYVFSLSWMWHMPVFQSLMPKEFNDSLKVYKKHDFFSMGHWGQFYRYDGTLNKERIANFRKTWEFPLQPLLGECDKKTFLQMYLS